MPPSWNASPDELLSFGIVGPEPDQAIEALDDRSDDSVVRERALGFLACGVTLSADPGVQPAQFGSEAGLELTPALDSL